MQKSHFEVKELYMNKIIALRAAGTVFLIIAISHVIRLVSMAVINIAGHAVPMWPSYLGLVIALVLALWMFIASIK